MITSTEYALHVQLTEEKNVTLPFSLIQENRIEETAIPSQLFASRYLAYTIISFS